MRAATSKDGERPPRRAFPRAPIMLSHSPTNNLKNGFLKKKEQTLYSVFYRHIYSHIIQKITTKKHKCKKLNEISEENRQLCLKTKCMRHYSRQTAFLGIITYLSIRIAFLGIKT